MSKKPEVGDTVRVTDAYGQEHITTVVALLSMQFTSTYEVARGDGGWTERQLFTFYTDDWSKCGVSHSEHDIRIVFGS